MLWGVRRRPGMSSGRVPFLAPVPTAAGEALASADVDREDVFLTTKVWRATFGVFDFALEAAEMARIHDRSPGLKQRLRNGAPALMRRFLVWFSHYVPASNGGSGGRYFPQPDRTGGLRPVVVPLRWWESGCQRGSVAGIRAVSFSIGRRLWVSVSPPRSAESLVRGRSVGRPWIRPGNTGRVVGRLEYTTNGADALSRYCTVGILFSVCRPPTFGGGTTFPTEADSDT